MTNKISVVTVFYDGDVALLRLQARSIRKNFDPESLEQIALIFNDTPGLLTSDVRHSLLDLYGPLAEKVEFFFRGDLGIASSDMPGWKSQQVIKLLSFKIAKANNILILDAKNHFIIPTDGSQYFTSDGIPKNFFSKKYGQQLVWAAASLRYFGNDDDISERQIPPTVTPYAITRSTLKNLADEIMRRDGSVEALFAKSNFAGTEFYLIFSYLLWSTRASITDIFADGEVPATIYSTWPSTLEDVDRVLSRAEAGETHALGVHSRRNRFLTESEWSRIVAIWKSAGIYDIECANFLLKNIVES